MRPLGRLSEQRQFVLRSERQGDVMGDEFGQGLGVRPSRRREHYHRPLPAHIA